MTTEQIPKLDVQTLEYVLSRLEERRNASDKFAETAKNKFNDETTAFYHSAKATAFNNAICDIKNMLMGWY